MLVDIIVRNHEVVAASPQRDNDARPPPIILVRIESGSILPAIKWTGYETYSLRERLENCVFGKIKGAALHEAFKIVSNNGSLDILGEYGSIEIEDQEFEADSKL